VLTPGIYNSAYFEHSFLAQQMGAELVEGSDLLVGEDDCVYMKTVEGLSRVDVIYRRIDDLFLDPEVFNKESTLGVRGLMRAWKKGNVALANAPGAGVADDKVVYTYVPDMIRYYLGEDPILPNVPSFMCSDKIHRQHVLQNIENLVVKPANESGGYGLYIGPTETRRRTVEMKRLIKANPRNSIAQPIINLSTVPTLCENTIEPRHVDLRPFILQGDRSYVTAGGLTRVALVKGSLIVNSSQGGWKQRYLDNRRQKECAVRVLSRVAERMYWFGRYVERAANTARLISVNTNLMLDLPKVKYIWGSLISITGYEDQFAQRFSNQDERNVIKFLLEDPSCSIRKSVSMARENARTSREIMPNEAWEKINELHLYLQKNINLGVKRDGRHKFLSDVMAQCQELAGYLAGSMSNDLAYNFIKIGRYLERADMTTRILDVGCLNLIDPDHPEIVEYENILWMNVLKSLTADQMYRQHVKDRVNGEDVVDFMIKNRRFPRAVSHCLAGVNGCFESLPNSDQPLRSVTHAQRMINNNDVIALLNEQKLHAFIDQVQLDLIDIHEQLSATWFGYEIVTQD